MQEDVDVVGLSILSGAHNALCPRLMELLRAQGMDDVWIAFDSAVSGAPVRLHGLWLPHEDPGAPVLLYLHGARWDVTGSAPRIRRMGALGFSVLAIDYRGFGKSREDSADDLPSEDRAYEDARAAWAWIASTQPDKRRYIFGHSLGSAIAVHLAAEAPDVAGAAGGTRRWPG